jgi:HEAT repeat protein
MVVAVVERWQLGGRHAPDLLEHLQDKFHLPAMLVAPDDTSWRTARAYARFDSERPLFELIASADDVEWSELAEPSA